MIAIHRVSVSSSVSSFLELVSSISAGTYPTAEAWIQDVRVKYELEKDDDLWHFHVPITAFPKEATIYHETWTFSTTSSHFPSAFA